MEKLASEKNKTFSRVTAVLLIVGIVLISFQTALYFRFPKHYGDIVFRYAEEFSVEPALIFAVIKAESGFNKNAVSHVGAKGLMQIMPRTGEFLAGSLKIQFECGHFSEEVLFNPEINIRLGVYYLSRLSRRFNRIEDVIAAYNAGEGNVSSWIANDVEVIPFRETRVYVERVKRNMQIYKFLGV